MKEFLETAPGKILLFVVVIGVWSVNFLNFSEIISSGNETVNRDIREISIDDLVMPVSNVYRYRPVSRDPFSPNNRVIVSSPVREEQRQPQEQPFRRPDLSLAGIIGEVAVITDARGESYFVSRGDSLVSSLVVDVKRDSVILTSRNNRFVLTLNTSKQ